MKKVSFIGVFFLLIAAVFAFAQVNLIVNPQMLPPKAPFTVMVNSDLRNVVSVTASFDGTSETFESVPASFRFYAPNLPSWQTKASTTVHVTVLTKDGKKHLGSVTVYISEHANPVIVVTPKMKISKNSFSGTAVFNVKVYGGIGIQKLQFMVDGNVIKTWSNPTPALPWIHDYTFTFGTAKMPNGWHTFSARIINVNAELYSSPNSILSYKVDNKPPLVKIFKVSKCLPASTSVDIKITAVSTLSGISFVKINNKKARRGPEKNEWTLKLTTPEKTGPWSISVVAVDNAGNITSKKLNVFVDGSKPEIDIKTDAQYFNNVKGKITLWRKKSPLTLTVWASSTSELCGIKPVFKVNGKSQEWNVFQTRFATAGTYTVSIIVIDPVNRLEASTTLRFYLKFDHRPPSIKSIKFSSNKFINNDGYVVIAPTSTLTVTITANDGTGVGLKNITISPVKAVGKGNTRTFSIAQLKSGRNLYPLKITLWDKLNNSTTISTTLKICVDDASPTLSVTPKASLLHNGIYWNKTHPLILSVKSMTMCDVLPVVIVKVNGEGVFSGKATSIDVDLTKSGNNSVYIISTNPVNGKTNTLRKTYMVGFDNTPPTIESITLPATKGPSQSATVIVKVTDTGIGIKSVKVNDVKATYSNGKYQAVLKTPELSKSGYWTVKVVAKDWLGNQSQKDKKIYIDARSPQITCSLFPNNHYRNGTYWTKGGRSYVPFYINVVVKTDSGVEPIATCTLKKDQPESSPSMIFNGATLVTKSGVYTLKCEALNPINGKSTECAKEYRLGFDGTPPVISNVTLPATIGPDQNFKVTAKVVDSGGGVKYVSVNNKLMKRIAPHSDLWSKTLIAPSFKRSRNFNVTISAIDVFGNKRTLSRKVFVDVNPPKVTLYLVSSNGKKVRVNPNGVYYFKSKPKLEYVALTDGKVKPETKMYMDWTKKPISNGAMISGTHFIKVVSTNTINGKVTTVKVGFSVVVDSIPPKLNIEVPNVVNTSSSANIKFSIEDEYLKYGYLVVKSENGAILYSHAYNKSGTNTVNLRRAFSGINGKNISIELSAVDLAGNPSTANKKYIYVDTVPPYIRNVNITKDGVVIITMSESVQGKPEVVLISSNGKEKLTGSGEVSDNEVIVNQFIGGKIQRNKIYKVEIKNVTDKAGNTIGNNFTNWAF